MKFIHKIRTFFNWTFSRAVLDAINAGADYEEVKRIAEGREEA